MIVSLVNKILLPLALFASQAAYAQIEDLDLSSPPAEIITLQEEAEIIAGNPDMGIEIAEYAAPQSGAIGLWTGSELNIPDDLWLNIAEEKAISLLAALPDGVESKAVQNIFYRVLTMETARSDFTESLLLARVNALLKMGQAELARKLLAAVPESLLSDELAKQKFLLEMAKANARDKLCQQATDKQSNAPDAFWQRFNVLCHAVSGDNAKVQLGLALLSEQNNASELFKKLVKAVNDKEVAFDRKTMQREELIWSLFAKDEANIDGLSKEQRAIVTLNHTLNQKQKGALNIKAVSTPNDSTPNISLSLMRLKPDASAQKSRIALLAAALRRVWDKPVPVEMEDSLLNVNYRSELTELSPIWRELTEGMLENNQRLSSLLMMLRPLTQPLSDYTVNDLAFVSRELNALGLANDAVAVAEEALKGD